MVVLTVFTLFAVCSLGYSYTLLEGEPVVLAEDLELKIAQNKILFQFTNRENIEILKGELGTSLSHDEKNPEVCDDDKINCIQFGSSTRIKVHKVDQCLYLNWTSSANITITDCFQYGQDNWYGGPENYVQYWPFNNMTFKDFSYISKMEGNTAIAEPYWLTSSGFYVYVNNTTPLFIDSNSYQNNSLCLSAKQVPPYLPRNITTLAYKVCAYNNAKKAHMNAVKNDLGHPSAVPDKRMIQHPIWSTWVRFKLDVNETAVRSFAQEIIDNGFNNSQIEIDDNWETCYGSTTFNKSRFPDMPKLGKDLHDMGFRVSLWNHPFINTDCHFFQGLKDKDYLIKDQNGNVVSSWWDGNAGVVDFTNPEAAEWYLNKHRNMMQHNNIDSLKLDAGESSWLPQIPKLNAEINDQPNAFTSAYVRTVAKFGDMVEVRVGHLTQNESIFVRMLDKDSKWTFENGLPTLLTTLYQMNLNGYSYVLPDMVGGNAYAGDKVTKEMFIRWLEANVFMPSIQFSAAPWDFDDQTIDISKKYTALHYAYSDKIVKVMEKCVKTGAPVNTPIWWIAPHDKTAHSIWSEYMLGEDILVAPVIEEGAVARDIYLPAGRWRDEADPSHKVYEGEQWIYNYPAPLDTLPFFTRRGRNCNEDL